jgi:hypothetical protein
VTILEPDLRRPLRRELVLPAGLTGLVAGLLLALGPAPGDASVHLYRTFLVRQGALLWDNLWYAGHYPLASYSLLYYFPAALFGNVPLVVAAAIASTALFASISFREWGSLARWPTRAFAVFAAAPLFTGLYSYTLGFTALLGTVWALQRGRTRLVVLLAALTLGFSPLAFVFLCLVLFAVAIARRRVTPRSLALAAALVGIAGIQTASMILFPTQGTYPFSGWDLLCVVAVCASGALLAYRGERLGFAAVFFVVWGLGSIAAYLVPTEVGDNWTRLRAFVFPLMLLVGLQARFRPRLLAIVAVGGALLYNTAPYLMLIPYRLDNRPAHRAFWAPAIGFLERHARPGYRVEVVPTAAHWESYWIPESGFALARGWYRQLDLATDPALYAKKLTPASYLHWLRSMSVSYVLLPHTELDPVGGPREAGLLRSDVPGIVPVFSTPNWTIYRVSRTFPMLSGPGEARLTELGHQQIEGTVAAPGRYLLRVRFNPYWRLSPAGACIDKGPGGMTELQLPRATSFRLRIPGGIDSLLAPLTSTTPDC